jgi:hypothetical protein
MLVLGSDEHELCNAKYERDQETREIAARKLRGHPFKDCLGLQIQIG